MKRHRAVILEGPEMQRALRIIAIVAAVLIGLGGGAAVTMASPLQLPTLTTRVSAYPALLEDWSPTGLVGHFPRTIPTTATNVSVAALPGFMQGSGFFQVRMKLPPQEVAAILE